MYVQCFVISTENEVEPNTQHLHQRRCKRQIQDRTLFSVYANAPKEKKLFLFCCVCCYFFLFRFWSCCLPLSFMILFRMQGKSRRTAILLCSCTAHTHTHTDTPIPTNCHFQLYNDDDYSHWYLSARSVRWRHSTRTVCIHHQHWV